MKIRRQGSISDGEDLRATGRSVFQSFGPFNIKAFPSVDLMVRVNQNQKHVHCQVLHLQGICSGVVGA